ncbi:hypothetical protein CDAR_536021 [Caerostris darwini]|uniref:Uncharacterized protein n=1 Tax=Caerostris darwini TaxID=1538125 RepID=A0AAV4QT18_9ARAC|nr:hypothetical protein CDAR_536021 [Caerostris darwini]
MLTEEKRDLDLSMLKGQIATSQQEASCVLRPLPCKRRHANCSIRELSSRQSEEGDDKTGGYHRGPPYLFRTAQKHRGPKNIRVGKNTPEKRV